MKKKLWYIIPLLLLLLGLLGPAVLNNNHGQGPAPADSTNSVADIPIEEPSGKTGRIDTAVQSTAGETNASSGKIGASTTTPSSAETGKEPLSSPAESTESQAATVNIAVVGKDGELLFGPAQLTLPDNHRATTVLGVLAATGLSYEVSKRYPDFVESIAGQRNKGQAGWLYSVNNEVPLVAANKNKVAAGDHVIWWYSNSINDPPPSWEQLHAG